jgi:8-oxo-dGTP diphosphatase
MTEDMAAKDSGQIRTIRIVAAVAMDEAGRTLLVRKRRTAAFMQPGGKLAPGEGPLPALERELLEELGCGVDAASCRSLGHFTAAAANEPGAIVCAELFSVRLVGEPRASGEIDELAWIDPEADCGLVLAPLTRDHAIPLARKLRHGSQALAGHSEERRGWTV